jgi:gentisate 1,2-dioxygenase
MKSLGTLEELPVEYVDALRARNLVPLWPSLRALLPPNQPRSTTEICRWAWEDIRPLLMRAGDLTPMEKAERRVLVLANPGRGLDALQASACIYLGMQLVLPGENAPNHKHTPNAARFVVEGTGGVTIVGGESCPMEPGDLILTPTWQWHEHRHKGPGPMIWLDVLDVPLMVAIDCSYHIDGKTQKAGKPAWTYASGGLAPIRDGVRSSAEYPLLRYPWARTRAALGALASSLSSKEPVLLAYINPETGADCLNTISFSVLMLRPGEEATLPRMSAARMLHVVEGDAQALIGDTVLDLTQSDTACAPGWTTLKLQNSSSKVPAFIAIADESPVHRKLGIFEQR